ncbi:eukaryotic translation initiation factor 4E type 2-like [Daktulosphaira vitifoliae]|uniref:eukaryotic translation initiation factor 4E type 2-like n=1 Tax=Daktulosphaira vitifoliae TaxID=58002 RepID=UPI0021AA5BBC|nr:eukaryotic translation initiation factor 4E type 2-like [Daktulosphaira vitifoliae]
MQITTTTDIATEKSIKPVEVSRIVLYPEISITYPIRPWTFWYKKATVLNPQLPWEEYLIKIDTVRDVNYLWKLLNHIIQPSINHLNTSLFVFDEKSLPVWEHETNSGAGRWIVILKPNRCLTKTWNNLVRDSNIVLNSLTILTL